MQKSHFENLAGKYLSDELSPEELKEFMELFREESNQEWLRENIDRQLAEEVISGLQSGESADKRFRAIVSEAEGIRAAGTPDKLGPVPDEFRPVPDKGRSVFRIYRLVGAAAVLFLLVAGIYLLQGRRKTSLAVVSPVYKNDVAPGVEGARLKLADGNTLSIDSTKDGLIAVQGKVRIYKERGQLVYKGLTDEVLYNEIITEKGQQWSARLPDGTQVWLNAASSLRYPLHFTGEERLVTMTGEVYFEVVHDALHPFRVKAGGQVVEDIGTAFNINAYPDEGAIVTTLSEGSAKVNGDAVLIRGQQSKLSPGGVIRVVRQADTEQALAWKNGLFSFKDADIQTVMRQLSRWYNVEVRYQGDIQPVLFSGEIGRNLSLAGVLSGLEQVNVHFKIEEDKRILILP